MRIKTRFFLWVYQPKVNRKEQYQGLYILDKFKKFSKIVTIYPESQTLNILFSSTLTTKEE
jgi:hypothetical protein